MEYHVLLRAGLAAMCNAGETRLGGTRLCVRLLFAGLDEDAVHAVEIVRWLFDMSISHDRCFHLERAGKGRD